MIIIAKLFEQATHNVTAGIKAGELGVLEEMRLKRRARMVRVKRL